MSYVTCDEYWRALRMAYKPQVQIRKPDSPFNMQFGCITERGIFNVVQFPDSRWDVFFPEEFWLIQPTELTKGVSISQPEVC